MATKMRKAARVRMNHLDDDDRVEESHRKVRTTNVRRTESEAQRESEREREPKRGER